ncbi:cathepsin L-like protease, partial [Leishmania donovani]
MMHRCCVRLSAPALPVMTPPPSLALSPSPPALRRDRLLPTPSTDSHHHHHHHHH